MPHELLNNVPSRAEQCRRLAAMITDERAREILIQIALEAEADVDRTEADVGIPNPLPE